MDNNKNNVLKKARNQKQDERERQIELNSFRTGWIGVSLVLLVLVGLRWYFDESATDIVMIFLAQAFASLFYQYIKLKERKYLIIALIVLGGIALGFISILSNNGVF